MLESMEWIQQRRISTEFELREILAMKLMMAPNATCRLTPSKILVHIDIAEAGAQTRTAVRPDSRPSISIACFIVQNLSCKSYWAEATNVYGSERMSSAEAADDSCGQDEIYKNASDRKGG